AAPLEGGARPREPGGRGHRARRRLQGGASLTPSRPPPGPDPTIRVAGWFRRVVRRRWRRAIALWRRSLQLRVVTTTTVFSLIAILVRGHTPITPGRQRTLAR